MKRSGRRAGASAHDIIGIVAVEHQNEEKLEAEKAANHAFAVAKIAWDHKFICGVSN